MFTDHWRPGWQDCYTSYIRQLYQRSGSDATLVNYGGVLKHFFEATGKEPQLVTRSDVELFVSSLQIRRNIGSPPSPRTRNNRLTVLSSFFTYACGFEYVDPFGKLAQLSDRNPCMGIKQSRTSVVHHSMTVDEFRRFMAAIPQDDEPIHLRDRALFLTLFLTCRRRREICELTYGNLRTTTFFDRDSGQSRDGWTYTTRIKGGEIYTGELPLPAAVAILEYLRSSGRMATIDNETPVFVAHGHTCWPPADPWRPLDGGAVWWRMRYYLRRAGMNEKAYSPHSLRHSGALARYRAGSGPLEIMHVLNHKSLQTTTVYVRELDMSADTGALLLLEKYGGL
jgi:integrase